MSKRRPRAWLPTHYVHDTRWSFGYVVPRLGLGWFPSYGFRWVKPATYHDCTATGVY